MLEVAAGLIQLDPFHADWLSKMSKLQAAGRGLPALPLKSFQQVRFGGGEDDGVGGERRDGPDQAGGQRRHVVESDGPDNGDSKGEEIGQKNGPPN